MDRELTRFELDVLTGLRIEPFIVHDLIERVAGVIVPAVPVERFVRCDPGMTRRQPFSRVDESMAIHRVTLAIGRIGQYSPSWCQGVSLPSPAGFPK